MKSVPFDAYRVQVRRSKTQALNILITRVRVLRMYPSTKLAEIAFGTKLTGRTTEYFHNLHSTPASARDAVAKYLSDLAQS